MKIYAHRLFSASSARAASPPTSGSQHGWAAVRISYPGGRSVASLAILADVGEGLIAGLVRKNVHEWMLRVPAQLKKFVESSDAAEMLETDAPSDAMPATPAQAG